MTLRRPALVAMAAVVAACATPPAEVITVHVFSNHPDHPEVRAIAEQLDDAGYRYRISYAETPGDLEVVESVIVHGDSARAYKRARELERLLSAPGQALRIKREAHGNHHFTAGNLGLYVHLPGIEPRPELKVRAHLAGSCQGRPLELFLLIDRSYRLQQQAWEDDYTLVESGQEGGDWQASGSGYRLLTDAGTTWWLEPPLDAADPAALVFFIRHHPQFDGCRLADPL